MIDKLDAYQTGQGGSDNSERGNRQRQKQGSRQSDNMTQKMKKKK